MIIALRVASLPTPFAAGIFSWYELAFKSTRAVKS